MREPISSGGKAKTRADTQTKASMADCFDSAGGPPAAGRGGYLLLMPRERVFRLTDYTIDTVQKGDLSQTTQASGTVSIPSTLSVLSPESGYAATLMVEEGEFVQKGRILARLDVPDLLLELEDLLIDLQIKRQNLDTSLEETRFALMKLQKSVDYAAEDIQDARDDVARMEKLVEINDSRQSELDTANTSLRTLVRGKDDLVFSMEETRSLALLSQESQKAEITRVETEVARLRERIDDASIRNPMDGEVLEIAAALAVPGTLIGVNEPLFSIADRKTAIVELDVSEVYSGLIEPGLPVRLTVGNQQISGSVTAVGKVATASSDGIGSTVVVKVKPQGDPAVLVPGSTVVGEMKVGQQADALYLPRGPYLTTGSQKYLYVVDGSTAIKREVSFGTVQGNNVVILRGIEAGEKVLVSGYQNFIEYNEIKLEEK